MRILRQFMNFVLLAVLASAMPAFAGSLTLPGTGFDINGNPLSVGAIDANWTLDHNPVDGTHHAYFIGPGNPDWWGGEIGDSGYAANTNAPIFSGSGWISTNATSDFNGPAPYTFSMTFSLAGFNLNTVSISGLWSISDGGTLSINGFQVASLDESTLPWETMHPFSINNPADFNQNLNTMSMTVTQSNLVIEAARFEGVVTGSTTTPEPGTLVMFGTGMVGIAGIMRRKFLV